MNFNPNNFQALNTLKQALIKNKGEGTVFTKQDVQDLAKSDDKNVSLAAKQVLQDKNLFQLIDNSFSAKEDLNDGQFVLGEINAALISLNPDNGYLKNIDALKTVKNALVTQYGQGPWNKDTLNTLANSTDGKVKAAANQILNNPQILGLVDNGSSGPNDLNDNTFQVGELDAAITKLDPLNPQKQTIDALNTLATEIEKDQTNYPNGEISYAQLAQLADTPNAANPALRAAARRVLNSPAILKSADTDKPKSTDLSQQKFQAWELKAVAQDLDPLNPEMQDVRALRTVATAIRANKKDYPDEAITKDQLTQMASGSTKDPSLRAAAQRILNNPQMLEFADNAFVAPNKIMSASQEPLNNGIIHAGELDAVANALHPLSTSSRNLDTLETIKKEMLSHANEYKDGVITREQLTKLQQSPDLALRQAANRLINDPQLFKMVANGFTLGNDVNDTQIQVGELDAAMAALSPYNSNVQITRAFNILSAEIIDNPAKYPDQRITPEQLKDLAQNGSPSLRQALATIVKIHPMIDGSEPVGVIRLQANKHDYNPVGELAQEFQAAATLRDELKQNPALYQLTNGEEMTKNILNTILSDPKISPSLKAAVTKLLNSWGALNLYNQLYRNT